jgi:CheY-like chemotaxis protein
MENHILLIDDDEDECLLLQMALQNCPKPAKVHQVMQFNDAVTFADTSLLTPNLIFLDLRLPEMPGLEILTWIRNHQRLMNVPVVIWSHTASDNDIEQIHRHGGNYFLSKIADQDTMRESVKYICELWLQ